MARFSMRRKLAEKKIVTQTKKGFAVISRKSFVYWSQQAESNRWPALYESAALPTELCWPIKITIQSHPYAYISGNY